jgi:hypothetical protein
MSLYTDIYEIRDNALKLRIKAHVTIVSSTTDVCIQERAIARHTEHKGMLVEF